MILYFVNGSHQRKCLFESDFVDDLYDVMIGFFEEHGKFPHFLEMKKDSNCCGVYFESSSEYFLFENIDNNQIEELSELIAEFNQ